MLNDPENIKLKLHISTYVVILVFFFIITGGTKSHQVNKDKKQLPQQSWISDNGDGTYTNPIIFADYSDPDVVRVGEDFYLVSSSFAHTSGLPVLHSRDLVNWKIVGHAIQNLPSPIFQTPQHGNGVWAPSIRYHNGEFWIFYGDPDLGIFMLKTRNPAGTWESPVLVKEAKGWIDPCPFWDDDGSAYLVHAWAKSRAGFNSILTINKMNPHDTSILDDGIVVFDGHEKHPTIEGPKIYKRNGYYYIFAPAGGVKNGWQTVLRSTNIYGPYKDKIVLEQGSTAINGPHQGAWVELACGESWFIHFQDRGPYGRIVHLQPMQWQDNWPTIGVDFDGNRIGEPVSSYRKPEIGKIFPPVTIPTSDDFEDKSLGLQWQWQANFKHDWYSLIERKGNLRLYAINPTSDSANFWSLPNIIAQKFPAEKFDVVTKISFHAEQKDDKAGLIIFGNDYTSLTISKNDSAYLLEQIFCKNASQGERELPIESVILTSPDIYLKTCVRQNAVCTFSYSVDGTHFISIGEDFQAVPGKWVGAKIGLFCTTAAHRKSNGYADFDFFQITVYQ